MKNSSDVINAAKKIAEAGSRMDKLARAVADQVAPPPPPLLSTCHYPFCGLPAAIRRAAGRAHFDSEQVGMAHRKPIMWPIDEQRQQEWQAVLIARFPLSPPTQRGSIELRLSNIISFSIKVLHSLSDEYLSETG